VRDSDVGWVRVQMAAQGFRRRIQLLLSRFKADSASVWYGLAVRPVLLEDLDLSTFLSARLMLHCDSMLSLPTYLATSSA
jgi:hypothetical protein